MKWTTTDSCRLSAVACAVVLAFATSAAEAQGRRPPPNGGGGGGEEETAVNNLAYPAVMINNAAGVISAFFTVSNPKLGETFSYGCDKPETIGASTYPNTSCMSLDGGYLNASECTATGAPCAGLPVDRIYWQKVTDNKWSADTSFADLGYPATHLDWGDNLESKSWTAQSVIRVETTPFGLGTDSPLQRGLQTWHAGGKGQTEQWGVRATDSDAAPLPYVYSATQAILHTTQARLNIAKALLGPADCPTTPGQVPTLPIGNWTYTASGGQWANSWVLYDIPYTAELNVSGKYVYGYNWQLVRDYVPMNVGKEGWWRLTFYTRVGSTTYVRPPRHGTTPVDTSTPSAVTFPDPVSNIVLAPPDAVSAWPTAMASSVTVAAEAETGPLYVPVVRGAPDHLSYIDICIVPNPGGGGRRSSR
jgi:hypothetical protein